MSHAFTFLGEQIDLIHALAFPILSLNVAVSNLLWAGESY